MTKAKEIIEFADTLKLLAIEDDEVSQTIILQRLGKTFNNIQVADNGREGMNIIETEDIGLVLLDIDLPDMNGLTLAKTIKDNWPEMPIILVSGHTESEHLLKAIQLGIDGFVEKPVDALQLNRAIDRVLQSLLSTRRFEVYKAELEEEIDSKARQLLFRNKWFKYQLSVDSLTRLFNRIKLIECIEDPGDKALLLINLDNFAQLNLGYGFKFGDQVLKAVADFLENIIPSNGLAFRLQSDEFAVLLLSPEPEQERLLAKDIIKQLPQLNLKVLDIGMKIGCTVGYVRGPGTDLIRQAHIALLDARSRGKGRYQEYNQLLELEKKQKENIRWVNELKSAIESDRLVPFYQPIIDNSTGKIDKYECLVRMYSTDGETISPGLFLGPAKVAGLMPLITGTIVEKSFRHIKDNDISLSVNISDQDFRGLFLVDYLKRKTEELQIDPGKITLEILEEIDPGFSDERTRQIKELKAAGFKIALDDFGVSCSNFSRINDYRPDYIKIDGRFIKDIHENEESQRISEVITQVAKSIGAKVVAEFVSSEQVHEYIKNMGIEFSQGFLLGKPEPVPAGIET